MLLLLASRIHQMLHLCRLLLFLSYVHGVVYDTLHVLALTCYFPPSLIIWFFRKDFFTMDPHFNTYFTISCVCFYACKIFVSTYCGLCYCFFIIMFFFFY